MRKETQKYNNIKPVVYKWIAHSPVICLVIAVSFFVAWVHIRYQNKIFNTSITVLVKNDDKKNSANYNDIRIDDIGNGVASRRMNVTNEIQLMKSPQLMAKVVSALQCNKYYYGTGALKSSEIPEDLFPVKINILTLIDSSTTKNLIFEKSGTQVFASCKTIKRRISSGETIQLPCGIFQFFFSQKNFLRNTVYSFLWRPVNDVADELARGLNISQPIKEASLLSIGMISVNPRRSESVLNQFVTEYNSASVADQNRILENTIVFINERLKVAADELDVVEKKLVDFIQKNTDVDFENQVSSSLSKLSITETEINALDLQDQLIQMVNTRISDAGRRDEMISSALNISDPTIAALIDQYNTLQLKRASDKKIIPDKNTLISDGESQIKILRQKLTEALVNATNAINVKRASLTESRLHEQRMLAALPQKSREYIQIKRQQTIKQDLYTFFLKKKEEYVLLKASALASLKPLSAAVTSNAPVYPDKNQAYKYAFTIGLIISAAYVYIRGMWNDKISDQEDVLRSTVPVIGEILHSTHKRRKYLIANSFRDFFSDQLRLIHSNIQSFAVRNKTRVILLTSSGEKEGKTFLSLNLGAIISMSGKKTLLIETDLRRPKFSQYLTVRFDKGLSDYLIQHVDLEDCIYNIPQFPNLRILPCGAIPDNAQDVLNSEKIREVFAYAEDNFDTIVIDTAPVGLVSDAKILAKYADVCLYVVRHLKTQKRNLEIPEKILQTGQFANLHIIVNDIRISGPNAYYMQSGIHGYHNLNSYAYNYGYGYKKNILTKVKESLFG